MPGQGPKKETVSALALIKIPHAKELLTTLISWTRSLIRVRRLREAFRALHARRQRVHVARDGAHITHDDVDQAPDDAPGDLLAVLVSLVVLVACSLPLADFALLLRVQVPDLAHEVFVGGHGLEAALHGGHHGLAILAGEPGEGEGMGDEHRAEHEGGDTHDDSRCNDQGDAGEMFGLDDEESKSSLPIAMGTRRGSWPPWTNWRMKNLLNESRRFCMRMR
jgi:hypothetical protein